MTIKISVIIPSYNSYKTVEKTIQGLINQVNQSLIFEVIVVDSSDDDQTNLILSKYKSEKIRIINAGKKVIPAIGRNMGAKEANGNVLVFIDSDAYPESDFIEQVNQAYQQNCLVGGGSIALPESQGNRIIPVAQFFLQFNEYMNIGDKRETKFVPSCNLFCDKEIFENVGGFPEIRASEDTVFGLNVNKITKMWFVPKIKVRHIFREDLNGFLNNQILIGKYVMIYRRKMYGDKLYYKGISPLLLLPIFLMIKLFRITIRVMKSNFSMIFKYLWSFPVFILGLILWGYGFAQGVFYDE